MARILATAHSCTAAVPAALVVATLSFALPPTNAASAADPIVGTMEIAGVIRPLAHVAAFEVKGDSGKEFFVIACDRMLPITTLKEQFADNPTAQRWPPLWRPYVAVRYDAAGAPIAAEGWADNYSFNCGGGLVSGSVKIAAGRIIGSTKKTDDDPDSYEARRFEFRIDAPLGLDAAIVAKPVGPVVSSSTGTLTIDGRTAKLAFVTARPETFVHKPTVLLLFSELDHSHDDDPERNVEAGRFGCALLVEVREEGGFIDCRVVNPAHPKAAFRFSGGLRSTALNTFDDRVEGRIFTYDEQETSGRKWSVDLKFTAAISHP